MPAILPYCRLLGCRPARDGWRYLTCELPSVVHDDLPSFVESDSDYGTNYKGRIGNLIRDARKHRGLTQTAARRAARHQPERDQPDREGPPEPLAGDAGPDRCRARLRDRRARRRPDPPAGQGPDHLVRHDRRQDLEERRGRPALRVPPQPRSHHAPQGGPDRGGQPAARGARQPRRPDPVDQRRERPRDHPAEGARPQPDRRGRRAPYPLGADVPRARCFTVPTPSSSPTPAAATSAPAPSSRTCRRCVRSASR